MKTLFKNQIKMIDSLYTGKGRESTGLFIAEGLKAVSELLASGLDTEMILFDKEFDIETFTASVKIPADTDLYGGRVDQISPMKNSEGILAVGRLPEVKTVPLFFETKKQILALFGISDPGNMGTLIRTALWFGADGIVLFEGCADIFSPKVIRSSMGAIFHIDSLKINKYSDCADFTKDYLKIGTFLDSENDFEFKEDIKQILFLGNEANGLDNSLKKITDCNFRIPGAGRFESLNVSVAGGIIMHEIFKIREA
jgi:RNA methyltransferase, TrmH family